MRLRLDIDRETHERLLAAAIAEKRPIHWQAEVTLRRALGLQFPRELQVGQVSEQSPEGMKEVSRDARAS